MSAPLRSGDDRTTGGHVQNGNGSAAPGEVARRMAREDRPTHPRRDQTRTHPAGATASADAVETLRRSITDIKHDVRMLKVVLDKQSIALDRIIAAVEDLTSSEEE